MKHGFAGEGRGEERCHCCKPDRGVEQGSAQARRRFGIISAHKASRPNTAGIEKQEGRLCVVDIFSSAQ